MFHHVLHVAGGVFIQLHSDLPCQSEKGSTDSVFPRTVRCKRQLLWRRAFPLTENRETSGVSGKAEVVPCLKDSR